jgi:hypothetical protein
LEAVYASRDEVNVVPPTSDNRVSIDGSAGDASGGEAVFVALPSLGVGDFLAFG